MSYTANGIPTFWDSVQPSMIKEAFVVTSSFLLGLAVGALGVHVFPSGGVSPQDAGSDPSALAGVTETTAGIDREAPRSSSWGSTYGALRGALEGIHASSYPEGEAYISGHVSVGEGDPLPGVLVRATAEPPSTKRASGDSLPPHEDLEEAVLERVRSWRFERETTKETYTAEDGSYAIAGLRDDLRYTVRAHREGWRIRPAPGTSGYEDSPGQAPGGVVHFVGTPVLEVPVDIRLAQGGRPVEAWVDWRGGSERWSPDDPFVRLEAGTYTLTAVLRGSYEARSEPQEVTLDLDSEVSPLSFFLEPRAGIRGRVIFPEDEAPESAHVFLKLSSGSAGDSGHLVTSRRAVTVRDHDGFRFEFRDLSRGTYALGVSRDRGKIVHSEMVEVDEGILAVELNVPRLDRQDYVVLYVFAPDGSRVSDVDVTATNALRCGSPIKRSDGSIWLPLDPRRDRIGADAPNYAISVHSESYGTRTLDYVPGTSELTVYFLEPATLQVTIPGYRGSGYEDRLSLHLSTAIGGLRRISVRESISVDGCESFGPLEPGEYVLSLMLRTRSRRSNTIAQVGLTAREGENRAMLAIPPLYSLTVTTNLKPGAHVQLVPARDNPSPWRGYQQVGEDLDAPLVFEEVPAGEYTLRAYGSGAGAHVDVRIPAQRDVFLEAAQEIEEAE